jgi:hypothetical protein
MARSITEKEVQVIEHFEDGVTEVRHEYLKIKWNDLSKYRIKRKKCKSTGKMFLSIVL